MHLQALQVVLLRSKYASAIDAGGTFGAKHAYASVASGYFGMKYEKVAKAGGFPGTLLRDRTDYLYICHILH
jgi:hypothetical protein